MSQVFKIQNKYLSSLAQWLQLLVLDGRKSRERTRFVKLLQDRLKEVNGFYQGLIEKYVKKDKNGRYKTRLVDGVQVFKFETKKDEKDYIKEVEDLFSEEFKLDLTEVNKEMLIVIKDIVLNTDYKFGPKENETSEQQRVSIRLAEEYDKWCQSFENLTLG